MSKDSSGWGCCGDGGEIELKNKKREIMDMENSIVIVAGKKVKGK